MSGNQDLFDVVTRAVGDVRDWYGTTARDGDFRARLLDAAIEANGGRRNGMVDRIVAFQAEQVGRGTVMTPKGPREGRGVHARRRRRPFAQRIIREEVTYQVGRVVAGFVGRGEPIPSARRVRQILRDREFPCGETAIRTGLRAVAEVGTPIIDRNRKRLSRIAQDLIGAFEEAFPKSSTHYTTVSECLRKLYVPSRKIDTQRSQMRRVLAALHEIEDARCVGISIKRDGNVVIVGRGRAVPENAYAWARETPHRHYDLTPGIVSGRAGLWSSPEGVMARDLVKGMHDPGDLYVGEGMAALRDLVTTAALDAAEETACAMKASANLGRYGAAEMRQGAAQRFRSLKTEHELVEKAYDEMTYIHRWQGLSGLWKAAQEWPGLKAKADDPRAQRRIARIAKRFAEIECPSRHVEAERFARVLWLDTPKALRSPEPPPVSDYVPIVPRLKPIRRGPRKKLPCAWAQYRQMYPAPALVSRA